MHANTQQNPFNDAKFNHMFSEIFKDTESQKASERFLPRDFVFEVAPCGLTRIVEKK